MHKISSALLAFAFTCVSGAAIAQNYADNPNASGNGIPGSANPMNKSINGSMELYPSNADEARRPVHEAPAKNLDRKHAKKHVRNHKKSVQKTDDTGGENK